ncbi:hypothetical protein BD410DRAFT_124895 [Rickenella mellea]|uniref:Zn(2)-C6 fungal-type domain-containing protein n=1 Tax=Rickenella mellea TaxID=50990 RepID=A0A4Y7PJQ3_9AGAM|nr:hypothetical protein BD410DRAFT_124895 [Rickenella mellea]
MGGLRFILEDPCAPRLKQKKTASRPVTACDTCRARKIKCHQLTLFAKCEACKDSESECHFRGCVNSGANTPHALPCSEPGYSNGCTSVSPPSMSSELHSGLIDKDLTTYQENLSPRGGVGALRKAKKSLRQVGKNSPKKYRFSATRHSPHLNALSRAAFDPSLEDDWRRYETFFDPLRPNFPSFKYMQYGADLFFDNLGQHFPFLRRQQIIRSANEQTLPAALANCIVGLGLRFSSSEQSTISGYQLCEPFIGVAKDLIIPVVSQPSFETLHGLLLLAWYEYARGHEAGLSLFSRCAVQMALDVGLGDDANIEMVTTEQEREDVRNTWWGVATTDIISSWVTGDQVLLILHQHDIQPPTASDSPNHLYILPFYRLHDLLVLRDRLLVVFNSNYYTPGSFDHEAELKSIQAQLADINSSIPPDLQFNPVNVAYAMRENRQTILILLHLVLQSLTIMINCPSLFRHASRQKVHGVDIATVAAQSIADILTLGESLDSTSNPFLDYHLAVASKMFLMESDLLSESDGVEFPLELAMDNLHTCIAFLTNHIQFWGNVKAAETMVENTSLWCTPLQPSPVEVQSLQQLDPQLCIQRIQGGLNKVALTFTGSDLPHRSSPHLFEFHSSTSFDSHVTENLCGTPPDPLSTRTFPTTSFTSSELDDSLTAFQASYSEDYYNSAAQDIFGARWPEFRV